MVLDEANYFTRRALFQFEQAAIAEDEDVARVHARLSDLYLERARSIVAEQTAERCRQRHTPSGLRLTV